MSTDIDIDNLEALARAATKGPWSVHDEGDLLEVQSESDGIASAVYDTSSDPDREADLPNFQHIAATNPDAILALIARLREAEEELAHTQGQRDAAIIRAQRAEDGEQALAAHLDGMKPALEAFAQGLGTCCCGEPMETHSFGSGHSPVDSGWRALDQYMGQKPATPLARRDAVKGAGLLTLLIDKAEGRGDNHWTLEELKMVRDELRRQAERADTAKEDA